MRSPLVLAPPDLSGAGLWLSFAGFGARREPRRRPVRIPIRERSKYPRGTSYLLTARPGPVPHSPGGLFSADRRRCGLTRRPSDRLGETRSSGEASGEALLSSVGCPKSLLLPRTSGKGSRATCLATDQGPYSSERTPPAVVSRTLSFRPLLIEVAKHPRLLLSAERARSPPASGFWLVLEGGTWTSPLR